MSLIVKSDKTTLICIGLMSGTSMDGIDAALLQTDGDDHIEELGHFSMKYVPETKVLLKSAEYAVRECKGDMTKAAANYPDYLEKYLLRELKVPGIEIKSRIKALSSYLSGAITLDKIIEHSTQLHSTVIKDFLHKVGKNSSEIDVIGYHGQAMYHQPDQKISIIVGSGQALANQTGIKVVNDFRSADVAAGGKGAPFAPLYHQALAKRDGKTPVAVVNCGGISNVTLIPDDNPLHLVGFDTGPGNGLIDRLVRQRTSGAESMDEGGKYGNRGTVNETVFNALWEKSILKDGKNYFLIPFPKALDIGDLKLVDELNSLSLEDACRTLEAFTAHTIVNSISPSKFPTHWILAGGGWNNPVILLELKSRLISLGIEEKNIQTADEAGWNNDALEAQIFAYLAVRSLSGMPFSFPGTTGVPEPMSGGKIYNPS
ncbi:MAG: anhydro-N-acetylmuramic acid kinase [Alphaproteobacteria bacterium]|nr:anhydro-N-acetylmuramic acid kinase [Alphaproteobacteria bacterium]